MLKREEKLPDNHRAQRIRNIIKELSKGLLERDETVAVAFLAAVSGQHTFMLGPPGTAKSLVSRRISYGFDEAVFFERLMSRFSTPEDVFGPISVKALGNDKYLRKTENYLPTAEFAFLDEIWKSSPAILNTLLMLVNERIFHNGGDKLKAPLKAVVSASNETPPQNDGLDALYDRFLVRLYVGCLEEPENFERLIDSGPVEDTVELKNELAISNDEWKEWCASIPKVTLSKETLNVIHEVRKNLDLFNREILETKQEEKDAVYVSDRRWLFACHLMRASAFLCGREETDVVDSLLLRHCLWTTEANRDRVMNIVEVAVRESGSYEKQDAEELDSMREQLSRRIDEELYHKNIVYETEELEFTANGDPVRGIKVSPKKLGFRYYYDEQILHLPIEEILSGNEFHPLADDYDDNHAVVCKFNKRKGVLSIRNQQYEETKIIRPRIKHHKNTPRNDVLEGVAENIREEVIALKGQYEEMLSKVSSTRSQKENEVDNPFVLKKHRDLALDGLIKQEERLKDGIARCDWLLGKIIVETNLVEVA